jgi:NitT/TauT family transport system substrate-binding protein
MIGSINGTNPGGVCFVESRVNPKNVKELKGMTLGAAAGTPVTTTFPALLALNGLPTDHVKIVQLQSSVIYPALVNGTIDIYECWLGSGKPILEHQARAANLKIGFLSYEDMGLHNIGSGFAATDETLAKRPDVVRKFLKASYRGYEDMIKNPAEGADITKKMFPESDRAVVYDQVLDINKLIKGPGVEQYGMGYIDPTRAKNTFDFVSRTMKVDNVKAEDTFTNDYISK